MRFIVQLVERVYVSPCRCEWGPGCPKKDCSLTWVPARFGSPHGALWLCPQHVELVTKRMDQTP